MKRLKVTIRDSRVICKQPGRYIGWPTVGRLPDGELLAVFSGDRDAHVDPFGKSFLVRSRDGGDTWSAPELINDTPLDDRDTGLCVCRDGTVLASWFTSHYCRDSYLKYLAKYLGAAKAEPEERWRRKLASISPEDVRFWAEEMREGDYRVLGKWIRRSVDGGRTWEDPVRVPVTTPHGPVELADGRLLFLGNSGSYDLNNGKMLAVESSDRGRTWTVIGRMNMHPPYKNETPGGYAFLCEPHLVETAPGRLLALARYEDVLKVEPSCLWQSGSEDGGRTWSEPYSTGILGKPPHLCRLSDGRVLATYGYRHPPYGQRACLSVDGGRTWDYADEIILRDDAPSGDLGYPASAELADGMIITVYYQQEPPGDEKPCLMATRWRFGE
ncbi:MAG TPA: sialidase family protein [bacterium]|uniref:BNR/Asp-box repeat protein n=1 Tax=candidate division TA06 bacterium ADurb.Bin417 TaxID=1852828 RepID=A0A1V5MAZ9_UNCT6|nr:MAG: BNR/Asp-box repeat protein [candidate division TA06 bacterium ADurb.Bin417]HNQ35086.1 sialidase family protein [bacterium]HNS48979.1 sialidase family protein [bacterium]